MPKESGDKYGCETCWTCGLYDVNTKSCPVSKFTKIPTIEMGWRSCWEEKREKEMTIKEFVSKHISCRGCFQNCCLYIDDSAFLDPSENMGHKMNEDSTFLHSENGECVYFNGTHCSVYGRGIRPFLCRIYPLRIANNTLFVDDWCVQGKKLLDSAINKHDTELIKDIASVKKWIINNIPPQLAGFWDSRYKKGKHNLGVELTI